MFRITFALGGLDDVDLARSEVAVLLDALVRTDMAWLQAHPDAPSVSTTLASGKLAYQDEPQGPKPAGQEDWQDIPTILTQRRDGSRATGNRDLVCWAVAEQQLRGVPAKVGMVWNGRSYRCTLITPDGEQDLTNGKGMREVRPWQRISFVLDLFKGREDRSTSNRVLRYLLDALTAVDVLYLQKHPNTPSVYDADVIYCEEPPGQEDWQDVPTCLRMKACDCDDFGPWRAAELRVRQGVQARAIVQGKMREDGAMLYHVQTELPGGRIEDPSVFHGMR